MQWTGCGSETNPCGSDASRLDFDINDNARPRLPLGLPQSNLRVIAGSCSFRCLLMAGGVEQPTPRYEEYAPHNEDGLIEEAKISVELLFEAGDTLHDFVTCPTIGSSELVDDDDPFNGDIASDAGEIYCTSARVYTTSQSH